MPLTAPNAPVGSALTPSSIAANGFTLGDANAKHTIDIYEDFQCPICAEFEKSGGPAKVEEAKS